MTSSVALVSAFWGLIGLAFLGCFKKIIDIMQASITRHLDQLDKLYQGQSADRAEHRKTLKIIREDLVQISGSVAEIRRIARTCEFKTNF